MKKLRLPVIKKALPGPPVLSMDDYFKFVLMHRRYFFNPKVYEYWKKKRTVNVRFVLK